VVNRPGRLVSAAFGGLLLIACYQAPRCEAQVSSGPDFDDVRREAALVTPVLPPEGSDLSDFEQLARFSRRDALTPAQEEQCAQIVERLGSRRPFRRAVTRLLNARGGKLDRAFNRVLIRRAWKKHGPLPNMAQVAPSLLRGGQPSEVGFRRLSDLGVKVVVNLRMEDASEKATVERLGMRHVFIPVPDTDAPTMEQGRTFLRVASKASPSAKVYFHCAAGVYRTGTMAGVFRISSGWTADAALAEAETFGFREGWPNADLEVEFLRAWVRTHPRRTPSGGRGEAGRAR
jgi:protein tyrosine phosphatase (PTP) superfamily phosphohydrolase (DUF442 family)